MSRRSRRQSAKRAGEPEQSELTNGTLMIAFALFFTAARWMSNLFFPQASNEGAETTERRARGTKGSKKKKTVVEEEIASDFEEAENMEDFEEQELELEDEYCDSGEPEPVVKPAKRKGRAKRGRAILEEADDVDEDEDEDDDEAAMAALELSLRTRKNGRSMKVPMTLRAPLAPRMVYPIGYWGMSVPERQAVTKDFEDRKAQFEVDKTAYESERLINGKLIIEELKKKFTRNELADTMLRLECDLLGMDSLGVRPLLLERLEKFDRGEPVLMKRLQIVEKVVDQKFLEVERRAGQMYGDGSLQFLALPHDLIRYRLFRHCETASLFNLMRTCHFLHHDAFYVLRMRAQELFGPEATPLALSCKLMYDNLVASSSKSTFTNGLGQEIVRETGPFGRNHQVSYHMLQRLRLTDHGSLLREAREMAPAPPAPAPNAGYQFNVYSEADFRDQIIIVGIRHAIQRFGSIEGVALDREKELALKERKKEEKETLLSLAPKRLEALNRDMDRAGWPRLLRFSNETGREQPEWTAVGSIFEINITKVKNYTLKQSPKMVTTVSNWLTGALKDHDAKFYTTLMELDCSAGAFSPIQRYMLRWLEKESAFGCDSIFGKVLSSGELKWQMRIFCGWTQAFSLSQALIICYTGKDFAKGEPFVFFEETDSHQGIADKLGAAAAKNATVMTFRIDLMNTSTRTLGPFDPTEIIAAEPIYMWNRHPKERFLVLRIDKKFKQSDALKAAIKSTKETPIRFHRRSLTIGWRVEKK